MKQRMTLCLALFLLAGPLAAQQVPFSPEATETCLAESTAADLSLCVGKSADACAKAIPGATEIDRAICLNAETGWWRERMDTAYALVDERAAFLDMEFAQAISQGGAKMTVDLAEMQAAWKDWSEKRCFFAAIERRGRPDRGEVASACMLHQTAEQALLLDAIQTRLIEDAAARQKARR
jgi:uncharacterized protein YecT (DUF1311 family)